MISVGSRLPRERITPLRDPSIVEQYPFQPSQPFPCAKPSVVLWDCFRGESPSPSVKYKLIQNRGCVSKSHAALDLMTMKLWIAGLLCKCKEPSSVYIIPLLKASQQFPTAQG